MSACKGMLLYRARDGLAVVANCDSWDCSRCAPKIAMRWAKRLHAALVEAGDDPTWYFWTLTQSSRVASAARAFELLPKQWDVYRQKLQAFCRRAGHKAEYVCKLEPHIERGGIPHLHVLCHMPPSDKTGRAIALDCGFGYIADVRPAGSEAAYYVCKYTAKYHEGNIRWPRHTRRVNVSRGFAPPLPTEKAEWLIQTKDETLLHFAVRCAMINGEEPDELIQRFIDVLEPDD